MSLKPRMARLLAGARYEQHRKTALYVDEAKARRDLGYDRRGEPLKTLGWNSREPSPLPPLDSGPHAIPMRPGETLEDLVERLREEGQAA